MLLSWTSIGNSSTVNNKQLELCDLALNACDKALSKAQGIIQKQTVIISDQDKLLGTRQSIIESYESKDKYKYLWTGLAFVLGAYVGSKVVFKK